MNVCLLLAAALLPMRGQSAPDVASVRARLGPLTYPRSAMGSQGGIAVLPAPPKRIVSLSGATDEYLYQVVAPELVVGVSESAYDEQFSAILPQVKAHRPAVVKDAGSVVGLKPDLVLTTDFSSTELVHAIEDAGIPVFRLFENVTRLDQVAANIAVVGYLTGSDEGARRELQRFEKERADIAAQCRAPHAPAKIYGVSMTGFSYGDQTLFQDVIRLVGGINIASENGMHTYEKAEKEAVARWDPEWVFTWSVPGKQAEELRRWLDDPGLGKTQAARKGQINVSEAKDVLPLSSLITTFARTIANATCAAK